MQLCFICNNFAFGMLPQLFILGLLHVLQPGHGQVLLFSSFALGNLSIKKILQLSIGFGILHSIFLFVIAYFLQNFFEKYHEAYHNFELFFALFILGIGIYLVYKYFKGNSHHCNHSNEYQNKFILYPILLASLLPCPSNMAFLFMNLLNHETSQIGLNMLFYSLGITASLFILTSLIHVYGKSLVVNFLSKNSQISFLLTGILILILGIGLLSNIIIFPH